MKTTNNFMDKRINTFDKRNPKRILPVIIKNLLPKLLLVINSSGYDTTSYKYITFLKENNFLNDIDIYYGPIPNLKNFFEESYNKGYRIIISSSGSNSSLATFEWLKTKNDLIIINTISTISSNYYVKLIPQNFIRTSVDDKTMLTYLFTNILSNFYSFLNTSEYIELSNKLINTQDSSFTFNKIIYIYQYHIYTESYLDSLREIIAFYNIPTELISIKLENNINILPDKAIYYLTYNNISNSNYITSTNKPLIFLNTTTPNSLMPYFNKPEYFDNYTILGDSFDIKQLSTPYKFTACFVSVSTFDDFGYKLSRFVDSTQSISFQILSYYKISNIFEPLFKKFINTNTKKFDYISFYNMLIKYELITTDYKWDEKYLTINHLNGFLNLNTNKFNYNLKTILMKHNLDIDTIVLIKSPDTLIKYHEINSNNNFVTYNENVKRINLLGTNIDTLLDTKFEYYLNNRNFTTYINFLNDNYKSKLEYFQYTEYYIYKSVIDYNIQIIQLEPIEISKSINKLEYILSLSDSSNFSTPVSIKIPEIIYYTKIYYYDINNSVIIDLLTDNYSEEKYDSFEIMLDDSTPNFNIHFFRGNVFKLGYYDEKTNIFTTTKIIRGYVNLKININWLIINTEYKIGDRVIVIPTSNYGTVTFISDNKYEITVQLEDTNDEIIYTQPEITPLLELELDLSE
jgi:hypothetical protein